MTKPVKLVVDCTTGVSTEVELTDEEIAQAEQDAVDFAIKRAEQLAEAQAKAEAKASALAKLTTLGLTEDEAKALLG